MRQAAIAAMIFGASAFALAPAVHAQQAPNPPPAARNAPPALAGDAKYRLYADIVTPGEGPAGVQGVGCVNQSVFFPGDAMVFRAVVADGPTGKPLTAADVRARGITVVATMSDGTRVNLHYGAHPPFQAPAYESYWSALTKLAPTHPTGTLKWTVALHDAAGHTTTFKQMGEDAGAAVLTIAQKAPAATAH